LHLGEEQNFFHCLRCIEHPQESFHYFPSVSRCAVSEFGWGVAVGACFYSNTDWAFCDQNLKKYKTLVY
jgi:hypothetical protein